MTTFDIDQDIIDSRDVIDRIEELINDENLSPAEAEELSLLQELEEKCKFSPDWIYGETIIQEDAFVNYIEELINDCYPMPREISSGEWPWRHMRLDYDAAAEEAKQDYYEFDWNDSTYFIRA